MNGAGSKKYFLQVVVGHPGGGLSEISFFLYERGQVVSSAACSGRFFCDNRGLPVSPLFLLDSEYSTVHR